MSEPVGTFNDGGIKFVRQLISLKDVTGATTQYIVKKGNLKNGIKRVVSTNQNDVENKQALMDKIPEGKLTLQFVNETDNPPGTKQYATVIDTTGTTQAILIGEVGQEFSAGEEAMVDVDIYARQAP
jgi:hypothetical protein